MLSKSSKWELDLVQYIAKFTEVCYIEVLLFSIMHEYKNYPQLWWIIRKYDSMYYLPCYLLARPELTSVLPFDDIGLAVLMAY